MWNSTRRLGGESGAAHRPAARGVNAASSITSFLREEPERGNSASAAALQAAEESATAWWAGAGFSELELARRSSVIFTAKAAHDSVPTAPGTAPRDAGKGLAAKLGVQLEQGEGEGGRAVAAENEAKQKRTYLDVYSALDDMTGPALKEAKIESSKASRQVGRQAEIQTDDGKPKIKKVFVLGGANKVYCGSLTDNNVWLPAGVHDSACMHYVHSHTRCWCDPTQQGAERDRKTAKETEGKETRQRQREEQEANLKRELASKPVVPATVMLSLCFGDDSRHLQVVARTLIKSRSAGGGLVPGYHEATCFVYKGMPWKRFDQKTKDWLFNYQDHDLLVWRLSVLPGLRVGGKLLT